MRKGLIIGEEVTREGNRNKKETNTATNIVHSLLHRKFRFKYVFSPMW